MYNWFLWIIFFLTPPSLVLAEIKTYEGTYTSTISYEVSQTFAGSIEILGDYPTPGMPELSVRVQVNDGFQFIGFGETTNNEQGGVIDHGDGTFTIPEISINGILTAYFSPNIIFVDDNATEGGDGTSWSTARKYLQDALAVAEYGDEIWVAEGTYKPDQGAGKTAGDRTASFNLVSGVGMYGGFSGTETTRNPQGDNNQTILSGEIDLNSSLSSLHVVLSTTDSTFLRGFTIKSGFANDSSLLWTGNFGGGLYISGSDDLSVVEDCRFIANKSVSLGGGVYLENGNYRFQDCEFLQNSAYNGGGIYNAPGTKSLFYNCRFISNSSTYRGGASFNYSAGSSFLNCKFLDNESEGRGGAIYGIGGSSLFFDGCAFSFNNAIKHGGALFCQYTDLIVANSIFLNNDAGDGDGGGLYIENTQFSTNRLITNSCFIENKANDGIDVFSRATLDIKNSIFGEYGYRESRGNSNNNIYINSTNLFVNIDNPIGLDGIWFTEDDGLRLQADSPAIDAGYNDALPSDSSDLDGDGNLTEAIPYDALRRSRIIGSSVDIGPYEFDPNNPPPVVKNLLTLSTSIGGTVTGGGYYEKGVSTTIEALPSSGYLFSSWSGDTSGSSNQLSITMDSDKAITANFTQDLNDDDGDGLSNFVELITYGTSSNDPDSDDDGLLDGLEVEYDTDPLSSDIKVLNLVRDNPSVISTNPASGYQDLLLGRDSNSTPYTPSWFYIPDQGWMWSQRGVYPHFYDANSSNWMYFQSGHENPRFYHYGTKEWMTLE